MSDQVIRMKVQSDSSQAQSDNAKLLARLDKLEDSYERSGKASVKATRASAKSYDALQREMKEAQAELRKLELGSKEFETQKKKVDELATSMNRAKQQFASGNAAAIKSTGVVSMFTSKIAGVGTALAGTIGVAAGLQKILDEIRDDRERARFAAATFEDALPSLIQTVGGEDRAKAKAFTETKAASLGIKPAELAQLLTSAISGGAKDLADASDKIASTLKVTARDPAASNELIGTASDFARASGGGLDFEQALGNLLQSQSQFRVVGLQQLASNFGPAIGSLTAAGKKLEGLSVERSLELGAVLSQLGNDTTGAQTATAARSLFAKLDDFTAKASQKIDGEDVNVAADAVARFNTAGTLDERLGLLRQNEGIRKQFIETAGTDASAKSIIELARGSGRVTKLEKQAEAAITGAAGAAATFKEVANTVKLGAPIAEFGRRQEAAGEALEVSKTFDQRQAAAYRAIDDVIDRTDQGGALVVDFLADPGLKKIFEVGQLLNREGGPRTPEQDAIRFLELNVKPDATTPAEQKFLADTIANLRDQEKTFQEINAARAAQEHADAQAARLRQARAMEAMARRRGPAPAPVEQPPAAANVP